MLLQLNDNRHSVDIMFTITNIYYGYFDRSDLVMMMDNKRLSAGYAGRFARGKVAT